MELTVDISCEDESIIINNSKVKVFSERDPSMLPWEDLGIDVVIESTGFFRTREGHQAHSCWCQKSHNFCSCN